MERNRLYGIGEPVTMRAIAGDIDAMKALDIMAELGVTAFREWMHLPLLLNSPTEPNPEAVAAYKKTLDRCAELDIEVTGMSHGWFLPEDCGKYERVNSAMPHRNLAPGSTYMRTLEMLEQSWYTMVSLFPQINQWEVGNEWNMSLFLHPLGWKPRDPGFEFHELTLITCDLMYWAAKGIRRANPDAKVVSYSPTPAAPGRSYIPYGIPEQYGIAVALEAMYQAIERGESFSVNSDDYFDIVAWHPYLPTLMGYRPISDQYPAEKCYVPDEHPDARWRGFNDEAYDVMARHGDGHKPVLITEFGFSDVGNPDRERYQAELIRETFETLKQMPYVKTMHFFRLFESVVKDYSAEGNNGVFQNDVEAHFGIVREPANGYEWRTKAKVLKEIYTQK